MFEGLFRDTRTYGAGLDAMWLKHKVVTNNIANDDTPGFKATRVDFESAFRKAIQQTEQTALGLNARQLATARANAMQNVAISVTTPRTILKNDQNNVDMDFEQAELATNKIQMDYLTQKLTGAYNSILTAIREGR